DLNSNYTNLPALWQRDVEPEGFQWLIGDDASGNTIAFARWSETGEPLIAITNFSPVPHESYRVPLPVGGQWREILNSDDQIYGGSGVANSEILSVSEECRGFPNSALIRVPPLGTIWLAPVNS
ncbi:MAG: hypothetical protein RL288_952, partial [Actinomycetota bacterium]